MIPIPEHLQYIPWYASHLATLDNPRHDPGSAEPISRQTSQRVERICGLDFSGADLRGVDWSYATLEDINLSGADLRGAVLIRSRLSRINLSGADLSDSDFQLNSFQECDFSGANLTNARLFNSSLGFCNLSNANLQRGRNDFTRFGNCNLTGADMRGSEMKGASFELCEVQGLLICSSVWHDHISRTRCIGQIGTSPRESTRDSGAESLSEIASRFRQVNLSSWSLV